MTVRRVATDPGDWHTRTGLAVIGAGGCGLTAALAAARLGARVRVRVLEKSAGPDTNTARSTGMIPAAGTRFQRAAGIHEPPGALAADILRKNHGRSDPALTRRLADTAPELVEWLVDEIGLELELVPGLVYPGHGERRMHAPPSRSGQQLYAGLLAAARAEPRIDLSFGTGAVDLIADPTDRVLGLVLGDGTRLACDRLILASNGFAADPDRVRRFCPEIAGALYFGGPGSTGEAIAWGEALGAGLVDMDAYQGHATLSVPHNILVTYAVIVAGGVLVDLTGARFGDESTGYSEFALEVLRRPRGLAFAIYDGQIHQSALAFADYRRAHELGAIVRADELAELATACDLPLAALQTSITTPDAFGRARPPLHPPFFAVQVTGALFHTQGGLRVDLDARVLRSDATALPNLYAGGGAAVGISGPGAAGYLSGNGLLAVLGLGLLAGRHAARAQTT